MQAFPDAVKECTVTIILPRAYDQERTAITESRGRVLVRSTVDVGGSIQDITVMVSRGEKRGARADIPFPMTIKVL